MNTCYSMDFETDQIIDCSDMFEEDQVYDQDPVPEDNDFIDYGYCCSFRTFCYWVVKWIKNCYKALKISKM